jgi:hypothetical protein
MPFHNIARTHTERKQVREFWEDMRKEAEKIHKDYTDIKEDKYHKDFYKRIHNNEKLKDRPDFFEPLNSKN